MIIKKPLLHSYFIVPVILMFLISLLVLTSCGNKPLTKDEISQRVNEPIPTQGPYRNFPAGISRDEAVELRLQQTQPFFEASRFEGGHECEGIDSHILEWFSADSNRGLKAEWEALQASNKWDEADSLEMYMLDEQISLSKDLCPSAY